MEARGAQPKRPQVTGVTTGGRAHLGDLQQLNHPRQAAARRWPACPWRLALPVGEFIPDVWVQTVGLSWVSKTPVQAKSCSWPVPLLRKMGPPGPMAHSSLQREADARKELNS